MTFFGLSSPFSLAASQFEPLSAVKTSDDQQSLSPISSSDSNSSDYYSSQQQQPPVASSSRSSSPRTPTSPPKRSPSTSTIQQQPPQQQQTSSTPSPPTSFADAQAAMAAQNSSHSQNLIGHSIDNTLPGGAKSTLHFVSILGLGAYGVVYLAQDIHAADLPRPASKAHPNLGNKPLYAVKCLNKVGLDSRQRNFQRREINLHAAASAHSNVVSLYNVIEESNCIYVVLEFCEEGDLFGMITERQRYLGDDALIKSVFVQILDAVEYCHDNKIYHRDLKPENILCVDDGRKVVLADFGLATGEKTSGDFGCGSTFYMSPECQGGLFQRLGSYSTPHNDIWSLGVILVNLTCGRNPWKQACPSDETFCAYLGNPDFLRSILPISEHTNRILKRVFALNPQARISLSELRKEILSVKTFTMTEDELRGATRATKEAARAFKNGPAPAQEQEEEEDVVVVEEGEFVTTSQESYESAVTDGTSGSWASAQVVVAPISPPATPVRKGRPAPLDTLASAAAIDSDSTLASDEEMMVDEERGNTPRRRRLSKEVFSTPPQQSQETFDSPLASPPRRRSACASPVSPVTPTRASSASAQNSAATKVVRPRSPRGRATRVNSPTAARRRKASFDSSSSSSGASSSQPPTPTGPSSYGAAPPQPPRIAQATIDVDARYMDEEHQQHHATDAFSQSSHGSKASYTAYYPLFADWADAAEAQQAAFAAQGAGFDFPAAPSELGSVYAGDAMLQG